MQSDRLADVQRLGQLSEKGGMDASDFMSMLLIELLSAMATDQQWQVAVQAVARALLG